jgi:hypothetical protein
MKYSKHIILLLLIFISLALSYTIYEGYEGTAASAYSDQMRQGDGAWDENNPQYEYDTSTEIDYNALRGDQDDEDSSLEKINSKIAYLESEIENTDPDIKWPDDPEESALLTGYNSKFNQIYTPTSAPIKDMSIDELNIAIESIKKWRSYDPPQSQSKPSTSVLDKLEQMELMRAKKRELKNYNKQKDTNLGSFLTSDKHLVSPNEMRYKNSNFIPVYEDSVFLSRTSDISHSKPIYDSASMLAGFCHYDNKNKNKIENKCLELENNVCASTSCCVLLGGKKCVAGDNSGPYMRSHYNDLSLNPKDHYFHQGKCYGNCIIGPLSN